MLLFVKVMISYMIPDQPEWVETAVARVQYQSKQAWRKEVCKFMYLRQSTTFTANNNIFSLLIVQSYSFQRSLKSKQRLESRSRLSVQEGEETKFASLIDL